jgi:hypothetical protein
MKLLRASPVLFWAACLAVGAGRLFVPGHDLSWAGTYEAVAHLWVGAMFGAWFVGRQSRYLWAIGVLTAVESVMFALMKLSARG